MTRHLRLGTVLALGSVVVLAACGGSSTSSTTSSGPSSSAATPSSVSSLAALLPSKVTTAGKVVVASDASYAPNEFFAADHTTLQGMDVDLGTAIGGVLGVKFEFVNAGFDTIIPGLGNRYDIGMSSFTDTKKREQVVDMVTYFSAGTSFMVKAGQNADLTSLAALCGKKVAVEKGTTQLDDATAQSPKCTAAGKQALTIQAYPDQNGANLALSSGRADVVLADQPVNAYAAKQSSGAFQIVGQAYGAAPYGIPVPKSAEYKGLAQAILGALKQLQANGTYAQILAKWGLQAGAVTSFTIDAAVS